MAVLGTGWKYQIPKDTVCFRFNKYTHQWDEFVTTKEVIYNEGERVGEPWLNEIERANLKRRLPEPKHTANVLDAYYFFNVPHSMYIRIAVKTSSVNHNL